MRINSIKSSMVNEFISRFTERMSEEDIEIYDIDRGNTWFKFRAKRTYNKPYCGGGVKYGQSCAQLNGSWYSPTWKQAKHLHWEEWKMINDTINDILDDLDASGSFQSWFDGKKQWIRRKGVVKWYDGEAQCLSLVG